MLGAALGTILLPSLSRYHASENHLEYSKLLDWGLRLTLLLAAPAAVGLAILAVPLIATCFSTAPLRPKTSFAPARRWSPTPSA
jgi:putative peptidoglycan lipid II flippase